MIIKKPFSTDPNKVKKCNCEDKYGPKPFSSTKGKPNIKPKAN